MTRIDVANAHYLSDIQPTDKSAYLEHFAEPDVSQTLLRVPSPYTEADADFWLSLVAEQTERFGQPINLAIRNTEGYLIGNVGFHEFALGQTHLAEIAYWLAKPYWGKGIMSQAVTAMCRHGFQHMGLERIYACVFTTNPASGRVLEKSGFAYEGLMRRLYRKQGEFIDAKQYALLR